MSNMMISPYHTHRGRGRLAIPLSELPLRPSTLSILQKRGFETLAEIEDSKSHGIANLAAELDISVKEASGLWREVQGCLLNSSGEVAFTTATTTTSSSGAFVSPSNNNNVDATKENESGRDVAGSTNSTNNDTSNKAHPPPETTPSYSSLGIVTAYDILNHQSQKKSSTSIPHIVTFSRTIDHLLDGGIALGEVTELSGMPASGKTQLAIQIALMTRIPQALGGVQGQALYVDCEGSFVPERAHVMAQHLAEHCQVTAKRRLQQLSQSQSSSSQRSSSSNSQNEALQRQLQEATAMTAYDFLNDVQVYRVHDETALLATLFSLNETIKNLNQSSDSNGVLPVRLVVIDSIAFHFRAVVPTDPQYYFKRTKTLTTLASYLGELASKYNVAVVVINQMTTKVMPNSNDNHQNNGGKMSVVVPALGESWKHATTTRLMLSNREYCASPRNDSDNDEENGSDNNDGRPRLVQERTCTLVKSPRLPTGTATFQIVDAGVRDVDGAARRPKDGEDSASRKRRRST